MKFTVSPPGEVLIERGGWEDNRIKWRYKRSSAKAKPDQTAAFIASLSADRPAGQQSLRANASACPSPQSQNGSLMIEWIEPGRHDVLNVKFDCSPGSDSQLADRLRHAPDLLGLHKLAAR